MRVLLILLALALSSCAHYPDPFSAPAEIVETAPTHQGGRSLRRHPWLLVDDRADPHEVSPTTAEVVLWAEIRDLRIDLAECKGGAR